MLFSREYILIRHRAQLHIAREVRAVALAIFAIGLGIFSRLSP